MVMVMTKNASRLVPSLHIDTDQAPTEVAFEAWADTSRPFYDVTAPDHGRGFKGAASGYLVDRVLFVTARYGRIQMARTRRHLRSQPHDFVIMHIFRSGSMTGVMEGRPFKKQAGWVTLQDFSHELRAVVEPAAVFSIVIPYDLLGFDPGRHPPFIALPAGSTEARLVTYATEAIIDSLPGVTQADAPRIANSYTGLLRDLLFDKADAWDREGLNDLRLQALLDYIDRHLDDPNLDRQALMRAFSIPRSSLFRLFKARGGIDHCIQQRRLFRCFDELTLRPAGIKVRSVAERYGFRNASHFNRLFKDLFYLSPSDIAPVGKDAEATQDQRAIRLATNGEMVSGWLRQACTPPTCTPPTDKTRKLH
ncbi:MAG: hypothetical protein Kilf2KO_32110 [Rhodospirillales bacterium]